MVKGEWQLRAEAAGLDRTRLAAILGQRLETVSRHWRGSWDSGVPQYFKVAIIAWELMTDEQRAKLEKEIKGLKRKRS